MTTTQDFVGKVMGDTVGMTNTVLSWMGDELGIWKEMAVAGPTTSAELAVRTGLAERPIREWLHATTAAGYVVHAAGAKTFQLPVEHAPVLACENGPMFFGGVHEELLGMLRPIDRSVESFRTGQGVPQSAYPEMAYHGMDRFTAGWFENLLLPVWIPAVGLGGRLEAGIDVADVGCGRGRAIVKLAQAFPRSRFVGYDIYSPNIAKAKQLAEDAGVADRVRLVELDATEGLPATFDLLTRFDVIHDAVDPRGLFRSIRKSLKSDGTYLKRRRAPLNEEAAQLAAALGEREILLRTLVRLVFDHADAGDLAGATLRIEEVDALARCFPRPSARVPVALGRSMLALLRADDAGHEASFAEARRLAEGDAGLLPVLGLHQIGADRIRDRIDALSAGRDHAVALLAAWVNFPAAFDASLAARRGDAEGAQAALARLDRAHLRTCMYTLLLTWVAEGAAAARNAEVGAIVEEALAAHAGEWASVTLPGFIVEGPVSGARAWAAEARGRHAEAQQFRRDALEDARRAGAEAIAARLLRMHGQERSGSVVTSARASAPSVRAQSGAAGWFVPEGDYWAVTWNGVVVRLKNSRGLAMLARLVAQPGRELAALDLSAYDVAAPVVLAVVDKGDAGELLDERARAAYRSRLVELEEELAEAEAWNDSARLARARSEADALRSELSRAVGLGGRTRRAAGAAERARINVQRRIVDAIQRIQEHHAALGRHLALAVRTGAYVSYVPERALR